VSRGFLPLLALVLAAGAAAFAWATEGFRVITAEGARRLAVERAPRPMPDIRLIDQDGRSFSFADYRGRTVLVDFIYTSCPTICGVLGDDFRGVVAQGPNAPFDLLSISFDPEHDDREALRLYGERYGASAPRWRIAAPAGKRGLAALLHGFGVVVIPDGFGGFIHNAAVYVVDPSGRLARILDPEAPALRAARLP
jgi:protein SCO1/2